MKRLYHWSLDPVARTARLALAEKRIAFEDVETRPWAVHPDMERLGPGAAPPAFIDTTSEGRINLLGTHALIEYLDVAYPSPRLLPAGHQDAAEARRLWRWCEDSFQVVTDNLLTERAAQWVRRDRQPDSTALRKGAHALRGRLTFLNALAESRSYVAGRHLTVADLAVAAHLSSLDYFGDVDWSAVPDLRAWYARMKSRPCFRSLLADRVEGTRPAPHYADLDF